MLKDITFGQYVQGNSIVHRLDPRVKLVMSVAFIVLLFVAKNALALAAAAVFLVIVYAISGVPLRMILKSLKPIMPIVLFTAILNMFFVAGEPLLQWKFITITREGVVFALILSARIICLLAGTTLLTYTTSPIQLTDALERLMAPLAKLGFPAHELAMMMTIALRFIPTLIEETDRIMSAQKSRGASLDTGTLKQRVRAMVPILVPLFVSSFRRADELALAMECRCYRGGEGRTRYKQLVYRWSDAAALLVFAAVFAAVILANRLLPAVI